jgi:hypothetical protein
VVEVVKGVTKIPEKEAAEAALKQLFREHGYLRVADLERRTELGSRVYKKGYEVRLVVSTRAELARVRRMLSQVGLKPGRPFKKGLQWIQPIYSMTAVKWFSS